MTSLPIHTQDSSAIVRGSRPDGVYLHVPFCKHKCHYCDFYSLADSRGREGDFVHRVVEEIHATADIVDSTNITSVFFGGGTPTLLGASDLLQILNAVRERFVDSSQHDVEWTVEANPETVDVKCATALAEGGVGRVSIGCQSFNPKLLKTLERQHDPESVPVAIQHLREAGISRINLDMIFAIPGSSLEEWKADLEMVLSHNPQHLSCYGLIFEPGTPLYEKRRHGRMDEVEDDLQIEMYEHTRSCLAQAGYHQYEISNWAKRGEECLHNLTYWKNRDWISLGPAASGHISGNRWRNVPRLTDWLAHSPFSPIVDFESAEISRNTSERLMLGFRLIEGFDQQELASLIELDSPNSEHRTSVISSALATGQLVDADGRIRFSESGILTSDRFLSDLIVCEP